jgi:hypothetical protein
MRPAAWVATLALALASAPASAGASECGGDGGSDSSSDSSDSSASGDDGDSEPACEEISPVVGHALCRRFGDWDAGGRPPLRVMAGASILRVPIGSMSFAGSAGHTDLPMYYAVVSDRDDATGGAFDLQVTTGLGQHLYAGVEGSLGALETGPMQSSAGGELGVEARSLVYASGAAIAGAAISAGDFQLRGELGVGVRAVGLAVETSHDDCVLSETIYDTSLLVRPRLAAQRWITPWVSMGASVGTNLMQRGETSVGLFLGGHLRAFR